jgi:hypothetical protein
MKPKRWQDWLNVVLGAWLVVSPWILGFADQKTASLTAWLLGAGVVVFAGIGVYRNEIWPEGMTIVLGLVLMGAPWGFGFAEQVAATASVPVSGVLVVVFGIWAMLRDLEVGRLKEEHRQPHRTP